jgi:hypothetical protein
MVEVFFAIGHYYLHDKKFDTFQADIPVKEDRQTGRLNRCVRVQAAQLSSMLDREEERARLDRGK